MTIRTMTGEDLPAALALWNRVMRHDPLGEYELARCLFEDRNHDPEGLLVAENGRAALGLVSAVTPGEGPARVAAICAGSAELTAQLLGAAERQLLRRGAQEVVAGEYDGVELAPGIDLRYGQLRAGFAQAGYTHTHTLDDMEIELAGYEPTPYQQECRRRAEEYGVRVVDWEAALIPALQAYAVTAAGDLPAGWFWPDWERGPTLMVALRGEDAIGHANYWPAPQHAFGRYRRESCGGFGPIGVLTEHRGHGIGTWLLAESQLRVQAAGRDWLWAGWTNTPFYIPNGWHVSRQFAVWGKRLEDAAE